MLSNHELIQKFYTAFAARNAEQMVDCYHQEIHFSDPVFTHLNGADAGDMWRMLCELGTDLEIEFSELHADQETGRAHWNANYTFSQSNRKIHNSIDAEFEFRDGLIVRHIDRFDLYKWMCMALGLPGRLLGWAPFIQNTLRRKALTGLKQWQKKRAAP